METAVGYLEYASSELCLAARVGYTKGDAPAAAEMARKDANQTGKGIKLEEIRFNSNLRPVQKRLWPRKLEKERNYTNDAEKKDDLKNNRSALLNSKASYSAQEHAP